MLLSLSTLSLMFFLPPFFLLDNLIFKLFSLFLVCLYLPTDFFYLFILFCNTTVNVATFRPNSLPRLSDHWTPTTPRRRRPHRRRVCHPLQPSFFNLLGGVIAP